MEELDIKVGILSLNRPKFLCEAIESILVQKLRPKNIYIYDNGSNEDVFNSVSRYFKDGVIWCGSEKTHSAFWNFRRAISDTEEKYILLLHDDDRLCLNFFERQYNSLTENNNIGIISCNGFFINESGSRTGQLLRPFKVPLLELYKSKLEIAFIYANNFCIPLSPVIYKTEILRTVKSREEYGRVADVVLFCDIADKALVAYQIEPLYECRIHNGQNSVFLDNDDQKMLASFFRSFKFSNAEEYLSLDKLLVKQSTISDCRIILNKFKQRKLIFSQFSIFFKPNFKMKVAGMYFFKEFIKETLMFFGFKWSFTKNNYAKKN